MAYLFPALKNEENTPGCLCVYAVILFAAFYLGVYFYSFCWFGGEKKSPKALPEKLMLVKGKGNLGPSPHHGRVK